MIPTLYLRCDVLLVASPARLLFRTPTTRISVDLDTRVNPDDLVAKLRRNSVEVFNGALGRAQGGRLIATLGQCALLSSARPTAVWPRNVLPLTTYCAVENGTRLSGSNGSMTLLTTEEALVVRTTDTELLRVALRMFVSRLSDPTQLAAYGRALSRGDVALYGDYPPNSVNTVFMISEVDAGAAASYDLATGICTGRLRSPRDSLSPTAGRLGVGEVAAVDRLPCSNGSAYFIAMGRTAHPNLRTLHPFEIAVADGSASTGVDRRESAAFTKCRIEALERFVMGDLVTSDLVFAPADHLALPWLDPRCIVVYTSRQRSRFGLKDFNERRAEWWTLGEGARGQVHLPAALVYCPFPALPRWIHASAVSSSGVAAHPDADEATRRAWLELVERDAFQRARLLRSTAHVNRITLDSFPAELTGVAEVIQRYGRLTLLQLRSPVDVPVFLARSDSDEGVALGMCAHPDVEEAAHKAMTEALAQLVRPFKHDVQAESVRGPGDHSALYRQTRWRRQLDWMLDGPEIDFPRQRPRRINVPSTAYTYAFRSSAAHGIKVVRVLDPTLIPITFGFDSDPAGRLDVAVLAARGGQDVSVPLDPHPFA